MMKFIDFNEKSLLFYLQKIKKK